MNTGWKTYLSGDSEGSLEWLSHVETLQISTFHPKYPAQLGNICPRVPRQWQILVPAPWLHMIFLTLFRVEQLWSHLTVLPHHKTLFFQNGPKTSGRRCACRENPTTVMQLAVERKHCPFCSCTVSERSRCSASANPKRSRELQWVLLAHPIWESGTAIQ